MRLRPVLATLAVAVALVGCSGSDDKPAASGAATDSSTTTTAAAPSSTTSTTAAGLSTTAPGAGLALTGAAVAPGPGDADGSGTVTIRLVPERSQVCYDLTARNIDPATGTELRRGKVGEAGDVVLTLKPPVGGTVSACAAADSVLLADLQAAPSDFFVLVLNETFPKGALRAQLR